MMLRILDGVDPLRSNHQSHTSFSVIVPTHDRPARLGRCLEGLASLDLHGIDLDVVVVDDGSTTPPRSQVDAVSDRLRIRLHSQPNSGPAVARNVGASLANHDHLAFTDDDCVPDAQWVAALGKRLREAPSALVGGTTDNAVDRLCSDASQYLVDALYRWQRTHPNGAFWTSNNLACSREEFHRVGGFDESFPLAAGEDRELGARWARTGRPLERADGAVVHHHHDLGPIDFWRQHRNYGRGAVRYRDLLAEAGDDVAMLPPKFYATLLAEPFRHEPPWRAVPISALIGVSQVATVAGYATERAS